MTPLTVVCFRWTPPAGYRSTFGPGTVRILRDSIRRHYQKPHRFVCITDRPDDIDRDIETLPLWSDFASLPSPHGGKNPSCYRRLKLFSAEAAAFIGPRFVAMDLDIVVTGDLTPIFDRPEPFVMYGDTNPKTHYNGSLLLMTAGARRQVWETFDPRMSPREAKQAGHFGSDQGWISFCLGGGEAKFSTRDGVYSYRNEIEPAGGALPRDARLVVFHGSVDPWSPKAQRLDWVRRHYRADSIVRDGAA